MMNIRLAALALPFAIAACGTAATMETAQTVPPATTTTTTTASADDPSAMVNLTPEANMSYLPAGIELNARLLQPIGLIDNAKAVFIRAELIEPIRTEDGRVVLPVGTIVSGEAHGPVMANSPHPALLRLDFDAVTYEGLTYPISSRVTGVDLALADSDAPTLRAGNARAGTDEALTPGAIISDPQGELTNIEFAYERGTIISLGDAANPVLPTGTRLTIRLVQDAELHSSPS